jgi:hypothetical protein
MITESKRETDARRLEEFERIKRGEHETLVLDEEGIVVLRSTIMRLEKEKAIEEEYEMIDLTMPDDDFKFEFDSSDSDEDKDEDDEDVIFEDCDYE